MASVTQKIPTYVLGMSSQPDERKQPGQLVDLKNGLPDVIKQLHKRPGSHLIKTISPSTAANTKWFQIYTDVSAQYIGQVAHDGAVKIWRCSDGVEIPVDFANVAGTLKATYLDNTALDDEKSSDIQVLTINETTFFCNRRKAVMMGTTAADKSPAAINEAYIALDTISYGKQYALDIYDPTNNSTFSHTRATGIAVDEVVLLNGTTSDGNNLGNGDCVGMGRETVNVSTGTGIGSTSPPNDSSGGKTNLRYEMDTRCTPQPTDDSDADNYHDAYNPYAKLQFGGEGWVTGDTHQYTSEKGLTTTVKIKTHVDIISRANIAMVRPQPTSSNNEEHVSAGGILGSIKASLDAIPGTGITATIIGNGIHLYSATSFGVSSPEKQLMNVTTSEANNITDLPRTCRHGYTVRIVNSGEDMDDYYLKFQAEGVSADIIQRGTYARGASGSLSGTYVRGLTDSNTIATGDVDTSTEKITITNHGWSTAEAVVYDNGGGTDLAGLTGGTTYYVIKVDGHEIKLATNTTNANAGTAINLTGTGNAAQTLSQTSNLSIITITDTDHGMKHGDQIVATFSGAATDGTYTISNVTDTTFDVTDGSSSGIITSTALTYTHGIATVTTSAAHGLSTGDQVICDFTSGAAQDGLFDIISTGATTFTVAQPVPSAISGGEAITFQPARYGEGVWEEVAAPGIETTINNTTMPLKLTRATPGTYDTINGGGGTTAYGNGFFQFAYPDWGVRDVGDDITNGRPSFVSTQDEAGAWDYNYIQKMVFFRNRIALLSGENVILSRVNDFYNFWVKTAMAISNADPIDLQSSSTYPTVFADAVESSAGLVLFSANEQFLLNSGAEALLTPETAKIGYLSSYAFNADTRPFALGGTIGFINSTSKNARFFEMANIDPRSEPEVFPQSFIIEELFPKNISLPAESTENNVILFGVDSTLHDSSNEVWGYRWFMQGNKRAQSAWFRWTLPNKVIYHTVMDDVYYAVLNTGSTYTFEKFDIKLGDNTYLIGDEPDVNRVYLDTKSTIASTDITYNDSTDVSTCTIGDGYYSANTLTAYCTQSGNSAGKTYDIPAAKITGSASDPEIELPGNWKYEKQTFDHTADTASNVDNITVNHVNTTDETITLANHNLTTTDAVVYRAPTTTGGSTVGGLSAGTTYYAIVVDSNTIKLATSTGNATAGTAVNLTSTGQGTSTLEVLTKLVVGYEYEFEAELPKIYMTRAEGEKIRAETRGSLVIHRMNFDFGDVGVIDVTLKRKGRDDYTYTVESLEWDTVKSNVANIAQDYNHTIPVYDRNINTTVQIKSNHPSPATLHSMNWEGDYSPRYYQRV